MLPCSKKQRAEWWPSTVGNARKRRGGVMVKSRRSVRWEPDTPVTITVLGKNTTIMTDPVDGHFWFPEPADANEAPFEVRGRERGETRETFVPGAFVALFRPPANNVATAYQVLPGSTVTVAGMTAPLFGQFASNQFALDSNPTSPTFGDMSGFILATGFNLNSPTIGLSLQLSTNVPFTINIASAISAAQSPDFESATVAFPIVPIIELRGLFEQFFQEVASPVRGLSRLANWGCCRVGASSGFFAATPISPSACAGRRSCEAPPWSYSSARPPRRRIPSLPA